MEAIISLLTGGGSTIAMIALAAVGVIAAYFKGSSAGKNKERVKQMERDVKTRKANDDIIDKANRARRGAGADDLMSDDGFRTD